MNTSKFLTGTIVGGIAYFLLGYLTYGMLMAGFFSQHSTAPAGAMKAMGDFIWWALVLANVVSGALLTYILLKAGSIHSISAAAQTGAVVGLLMALSVDLVRYSTENSFDLTALVVDAILGLVITAIVGGIIAAVIGRGAKKV